MMSRNILLDYIKNKESSSDNNKEAFIAFYIMRLLLETREDYSVTRFKFLIAKALKKGISNPVLFDIYKEVLEFIGG